MQLPRDGKARGVDFKSHEETVWSDGYAHYLDSGDAFMGICICQKSSNLHFKYVPFIVNYTSQS